LSRRAELFATLPLEDDLPKPLSPSGASLLIDDAMEPAISTLSPVLITMRAELCHRARPSYPQDAAIPAQSGACRAQSGRDALSRACCGGLAASGARSGLNAVKAILSSPVAAPLFGEESRAEVAIMGKLTIRGRERVVSGTIDRLAVTAERF
jgi:ATP-dependent helicase/nuclease subunit A